MSADNYIRVDHDGTHYLVGMGFASDEGGPKNWSKYLTLKEVDEHISNISVIEYGVEFTGSANFMRHSNQNQKDFVQPYIAAMNEARKDRRYLSAVLKRLSPSGVVMSFIMEDGVTVNTVEFMAEVEARIKAEDV